MASQPRPIRTLVSIGLPALTRETDSPFRRLTLIDCPYRREPSFASRCPLHSPVIGNVERLLSTANVSNLSAHRQAGTGVLQHGDGAHRRPFVVLVQPYLDL